MRASGGARLAAVAAALLMLAAAGAAGTPARRQEGKAPEAPKIAAACRLDLAARLRIEPGQVAVKSVVEVEWPDAALGLRRPGETAARVRTAGHCLVLATERPPREYLYTAAGEAFRYGGPLDLWPLSAVTVEGGEGDANLNGSLAQYALAGANREVLLEAVSEAYPQPDGSLFAKRRTSRSGHVLLYGSKDAPCQASAVASAFDFVDAAAGPDGKRGAALARIGPQLEWELVVVDLAGGGAEPRRVALPEGLRPERLVWRRDGDPDDVAGGEGHGIVLIGTREGKRERHGLADLGGRPRWEGLPAYVASDDWEFVLSKSHSLGVAEVEVDGRTAVRVEYVWWNRGPDEIATIPDLELEGFQWARGRDHLFVTGRRGDGHAAYVVDIGTGEALTVVTGARNPVKLFRGLPDGWVWIARFTGLRK